MIEAVFWDNDGVLVDTEPLYFRATQQVLATIGIALTEEDYTDLFLVEGRGAWHLAEARGVGQAEIERLRGERNAIYTEWISERPHLVDGIAAVLEALRGKYVMGIVTTCIRDHFEAIHRSTGLLEYFDFVLTNGDYARSKPHPDPYLRAVERSGVAAGACVAIEDSARGLAAAKAAGIRCFVVPNRLTRRCVFAGADRILGNVADIPDALDAAGP